MGGKSKWSLNEFVWVDRCLHLFRAVWSGVVWVEQVWVNADIHSGLLVEDHLSVPEEVNFSKYIEVNYLGAVFDFKVLLLF